MTGAGRSQPSTLENSGERGGDSHQPLWSTDDGFMGPARGRIVDSSPMLLVVPATPSGSSKGRPPLENVALAVAFTASYQDSPVLPISAADTFQFLFTSPEMAREVGEQAD